MTTLAKIAANRANARLSTGPRTPAGKGVAARNALRHRLLAATPIVAGEDAAAWGQHLAGVTESLDPVGPLEQQLAGRAALLLWRIARVARYEAATITAAVDDALLPRPAATDPVGSFRTTTVETTPTALAEARRESADAGRAADDLRPQVEYLKSLAEQADDEPAAPAVAVGVLGAAYQVLFDYELAGNPPEVDSRPFLGKLGRAEKAADRVPWTAGLVRRGLAVYAGFADETAEWMVAEAREYLAGERRRQVRLRRTRERLAAGLAERRRLEPGWRAADALLPRLGVDDRIARYESHLSKQLAATLRELERLQDRRAGRPVVPQEAVEVTVSAAPHAG